VWLLDMDQSTHFAKQGQLYPMHFSGVDLWTRPGEAYGLPCLLMISRSIGAGSFFVSFLKIKGSEAYEVEYGSTPTPMHVLACSGGAVLGKDQRGIEEQPEARKKSW
jgi:hypothetical protein